MTFPNELLTVQIARVRELCPGVRSFELARPDGAALPPFAPGAHIDVRVGPGLIRQYSLCNSARERSRYVIAVQREDHGRGGSREMHDRYREGHSIVIGWPRNDFPLIEDGAGSLLLAGGIGITPLLSMAETLASTGRRFELHHFVRTPDRAVFTDELDRLAESGRVVRHHDTDPGRPDLEAIIGGPADRERLYLCGPEGFMTAVQTRAAACGWPSDRIHLEHFDVRPDAAQQEAVTGSEFQVVCSASDVTINVGPNERIIDALRAAGVAIETSCEVGVCGTCVTRVLSGEVEHLDDVLSQDERESGVWITPCCSRAAGPQLVLDL